MKIAKLYIGKKEIAEKLGISEDDFIFANVNSDYSHIEFDLIMGNDVETNNIHLSFIVSEGQIKRQQL
jgi:hypothetical protein